MLHRYYLALLFEDATKDQSIPFGHDAGPASEMLADLTQNGGPDGICRAILYSTRKNRTLVRTIYPTSTLQLQATQAQESTAKRTELELARKRTELTSRLEALRLEAGELDMSDILFVPTSASGSDDEIDDDESDLGNENTPPAPPAGTPGASAAAPAVVAPPAPPAPPVGTQGAAKANAPKAKAGNAPKAGSDDAKPSEGAAGSDSASEGGNAPGNLLDGV